MADLKTPQVTRQELDDLIADAVGKGPRQEKAGMAAMTPGQILDRHTETDEERAKHFLNGERAYRRVRHQWDGSEVLPLVPEDPNAIQVDENTAAYDPGERKRALWEQAKGRELEVIDEVATSQTMAMEGWIRAKADGDKRKERALYQLMLQVVRGFVRAELPNANLTDADLDAMTLGQMMAMRARNSAEMVYADIPELNRPLVIGD